MRVQFIHNNEHIKCKDIKIPLSELQLLINGIEEANIKVYKEDFYVNIFSYENESLGDTISHVDYILNPPPIPEFSPRERND